jgi:hypothetical protein
LIDFWLEGLHVSPDGMDCVQKHVECENIRVYYGPPDGETDARYYPDRNVLVLGFRERDLLSRATIFHELVHALVDAKYCTETLELHNEAAGYLAQTLYGMIEDPGWFGRRLERKVGDPTFNYNNEAFLVAKPIIQKYMTHPGGALAVGVKLTTAQYQPLLDAIPTWPKYKGISVTKKAVANGVLFPINS